MSKSQSPPNALLSCFGDTPSPSQHPPFLVLTAFLCFVRKGQKICLKCYQCLTCIQSELFLLPSQPYPLLRPDNFLFFRRGRGFWLYSGTIDHTSIGNLFFLARF